MCSTPSASSGAVREKLQRSQPNGPRKKHSDSFISEADSSASSSRQCCCEQHIECETASDLDEKKGRRLSLTLRAADIVVRHTESSHLLKLAWKKDEPVQGNQVSQTEL